MKELSDEIKLATTTMVCTDHHKKAAVAIIKDKVEFICCCEAFKKKVIHALPSSVLAEHEG